MSSDLAIFGGKPVRERPFPDWPRVTDELKHSLINTLENDKWGVGSGSIDQFNTRFSKMQDAKYSLAIHSGTSAIWVCLKAAGVEAGDEVIVPSYTFTSTANCVLMRNAKPIFADINLNDINLNPKSVEKKINKKTKAIIIVHYGGVACDMEIFLKLKKKYNLYLIEDAAHGFLGKYKNKFLGTIGDLGAFSFHETKNIVGGQCGALSINNNKFINRANIILDKGTDRTSKRKKSYYSWKDIGSEYRAPELSAALLYSQLLDVKKIQSKREIIWNNYYNVIKKIKTNLFYLPLKKNKNIKNAFHVFPIVFKNKKLKNKFIKFMKKKNIECFFHYYPLHMSTFGKKISKTTLKNTETIFDGLVRLPLYPNLTFKNQQKILKYLNLFVQKYHFL